MIGLDTNILVRFIVQDDKKQSKLAVDFIASHVRKGTHFFISHIVLCELAWVLQRNYKYNREQITNVLEHLLLSKEIMVDNAVLVWEVLEQYRVYKADFSDCLIGQINLLNRCTKTVTFDKQAAGVEGIELLTLTSKS